MSLPNDAELTDGRRSVLTVSINADTTDALDKINELSKAIESLSEKAKALNSVDIKQIMNAVADRISECAESRMVNE